VVDVRG